MNDQKKAIARINRDDDWGAPPKPAPIDRAPPVRAIPTPTLPEDKSPVPIKDIDLTRPPGFVGQLAAWIETQNLRPRETLAVAGALVAIGNIAGLKYTDDSRKPVTTNVFAFCVAGSRTGKEAVLQGVEQIHRVAALAACTYSRPKSEQEVVRNLIRHQPCFFVVDEIGYELTKIRNASKRGGAVYLEGIIAVWMSAYSKANSYLNLTGDAKAEAAKELAKTLSRFEQKAEDAPADQKAYFQTAVVRTRVALEHIDQGIYRPFVSLIGFATPITFSPLVDKASAADGFFGRSMIFNETDTAPAAKDDFTPIPMPPEIENMIRSIATAGQAVTPDPGARIEFFGDKVAIPTTPDARAALGKISKWFDTQARLHVERSGMEALFLGAFELVLKVSLILGIPDGERTLEHVRWAFKLVWNDVERKIMLVLSNDGTDDANQKLASKIMAVCEGNGTPFKTIKNMVRSFKITEADLQNACDALVKRGALVRIDTKNPTNGKDVVKYRAVFTDESDPETPPAKH